MTKQEQYFESKKEHEKLVDLLSQKIEVKKHPVYTDLYIFIENRAVTGRCLEIMTSVINKYMELFKGYIKDESEKLLKEDQLNAEKEALDFLQSLKEDEGGRKKYAMLSP